MIQQKKKNKEQFERRENYDRTNQYELNSIKGKPLSIIFRMMNDSSSISSQTGKGVLLWGAFVVWRVSITKGGRMSLSSKTRNTVKQSSSDYHTY